MAEIREMGADEYAQWRAFYEVEAEEASGTEGTEKRVVSDPAEIQRWFATN